MQSLPFPLSDELIEIQKTIHKMSEAQLKPYRRQRDEAMEFPKELWIEFGQLGLLGITANESYGGSGLGYLAHVLVMEEISRGDAAIGLSYGAILIYVLINSIKMALKSRKKPIYPHCVTAQLLVHSP